MKIEDIAKHEREAVTVTFDRRPYKSTLMLDSVKWSDVEEPFTLFRAKVAKREYTDHKGDTATEWLLCNNFIGNPRLRVLVDMNVRGGYNHVLEITPEVLSHIINIKINRNL